MTTSQKNKNRLAVPGIITGAVLLICSPLVGVIGTLIGMRGAFAQFDKTGVGEPTKLSKSIGTVMDTTAANLILGLAGAIILAISFIFYVRNRKIPPALPEDC